MGDPRLLDEMINDYILDFVIAKVVPLYNDSGFEPDIIKKASIAAMGICKWVRAMVIYDEVAKGGEVVRRLPWDARLELLGFTTGGPWTQAGL